MREAYCRVNRKRPMNVEDTSWKSEWVARLRRTSGVCWLQERSLGAWVTEPGNGAIFGLPGERKAGGSAVPPQTAFVKKACRAELKSELMKRSFSLSITIRPKLCKGLL